MTNLRCGLRRFHKPNNVQLATYRLIAYTPFFMPLRLEIFGRGFRSDAIRIRPEGKWGMFRIPNGTLADEILIFGPSPDDSKSLIYKTKLEFTASKILPIFDREDLEGREGFEKLSEIRIGDVPYQFLAVNKNGKGNTVLRFTHMKKK